MRAKFFSACAVIVVGMTLSFTGMGAASAAPARPAASTPPYHFSGVYIVKRTLAACTFKPCQTSPLSLMIFSPSKGVYDLTADYGPDSVLGQILGGKSVWQPAISLSWNGKAGAWQGTGTWKVVECSTTTLGLATATFAIHAPTSTPDGQAASDVTGTLTYVTKPGVCGYPKSSKAVENLTSGGLYPSWWKGICDDHNTSAAPAPYGPFRSKQGAEWRGLISCAAVSPPQEGGQFHIATGPLTGDLEWQCAELAQRWLYMAFGLKSVAVPNGAKDIAVNYYNAYLKSNPKSYPLVYLTPASPGLKQGDLSPGDIISYAGISSNEAGHVAIVVSVSDKGYQLLEQNPSDVTGTIPWASPGVPGPYPLGGNKQYAVAGWLHVTRP